MDTIETKSSLETMSVREFAQMKGFTTFVKEVRANKNGLPYITMLKPIEGDPDGKMEAENIYFSKSAGSKVKPGQPFTSFVGYQVASVLNAENEQRYKLITNSDNRMSIEDAL